MNKSRHFCLVLLWFIFSSRGQAQKRFIDPVFNPDQISIQRDIPYADNIDFLTSRFDSPGRTATEVADIRAAIVLGQPIPPSYYDSADTSSILKVTSLKFDVYFPSLSVDTMAARP